MNSSSADASVGGSACAAVSQLPLALSSSIDLSCFSWASIAWTISLIRVTGG
eukprot:CAMPEP_0205942698 /NCGR_PEP_ID=MMETSP1325-20131115/58347_1 /ASSEMBLY_ACC=CAM_ASM_000708 /TAXON_ID=236786 /ORGANISM="Florenciella sp., Strain RCC1007" /LENGTH=51 /DNA_ID=CAMNT_0053313443 /DNA_START=87 /DNA_END=238 /DNA_ORIENTATION=+